MHVQKIPFKTSVSGSFHIVYFVLNMIHHPYITFFTLLGRKATFTH